MTQTSLNILITGFGAFPGVKNNPCAFLIEHLQHSPDLLDNITLHPHMLETAWNRAPQQLAGLYKSVQPDIALHFGYDQFAQGLCLEKYAHNSTIQSLDHYGDLPPFHKVKQGGQARLETVFPIADIVTYLHEGEFPAQTSTDAGHYLCNMVYYLSCLFAQSTQERKVQTLFVHIPPIKVPSGKLIPEDSEAEGVLVYSHQQLITGVRHILRYCRDFHIMQDENNLIM